MRNTILSGLLDSVKDIVDEIILVDTGSTDKTKEIASEYGAKVFDFKWTGDFGEARNVSMDQATCDWILIMDPDEKLSPKDHNAIRDLIRDNPSAVYYLNTRNYK